MAVKSDHKDLFSSKADFVYHVKNYIKKKALKLEAQAITKAWINRSYQQLQQ